MEEKSTCKVCVTGGAGYIGSSLVQKLLDKGYIVHATLRNLEDESKVGLLKSLSGADKRLKLFKADIYKAEEFEEAIQGCEFVFHVATPLLHSQGSQYKDRTEATVDGVKKIGMICLKSGTVKRLIYTASIVAASPLKEDAITYKELIDETCWTPLNFSNPYTKQWLWVETLTYLISQQVVLCSCQC
ncbi:NADPH HC-toxin reductase 1-like [Solanum lycopersicum]|uniref:NADPH HC-toxin reductase 1-like n=1 Tax=Solanum lycopersicum TaxID=4081 RepID=UPI000276BF90